MNTILFNTAGSIALAIDYEIQGAYSDLFLTKEADKTIRINAEFFVRVGAAIIVVADDTDLTVADLDAGADFSISSTYYIYACHPLSGSTPVFMISENTTYPAGGWGSDTSRKIGGFDTDGSGNVDAATLWDLRTVALDGMASNVHASAHERGGTDEINGDHLDIDFTPTYYTPDTSIAEASTIADLAAHLAGIDNIIGPDVYGVSWDEDADADTYVRTGKLASEACGVSPGNAKLPIHKLIRRCVLNDDGTVNYYLDPNDSTLKADGVTASVLDGTDGQVMVEIPKFYYRYSYAGTVHTWDISRTQLSGFSLHPAFSKGGTTLDHKYVGAYEAYKEGTAVLSSESGLTPAVTATRAAFRGYAAARGTGWHQLDFYTASMTQLLYLIEYADLDSQAMIGEGNTKYAAWPGSPPSVTGLSNGDGNGTGNKSTAGGAAGDYMVYRGIENIYGHIHKWVDGINVNDNVPYVCQNPDDFADDTVTGYTDLGVTLAAADGYGNTLAAISAGFLPVTVGAGSNTKLCDYYYQAADWRVARLGGWAGNGLRAGAFGWGLTDDSSDSYSYVGGRLCF